MSAPYSTLGLFYFQCLRRQFLFVPLYILTTRIIHSSSAPTQNTERNPILLLRKIYNNLELLIDFVLSSAYHQTLSAEKLKNMVIIMVIIQKKSWAGPNSTATSKSWRSSCFWQTALPSQYLQSFWLSFTNTESETGRLVQLLASSSFRMFCSSHTNGGVRKTRLKMLMIFSLWKITSNIRQLVNSLDR